MSTTYPIKDETQLKKFKEYYLLEKPVCRNYALIILGLNTAFRISDLLLLEWKDVFYEEENRCREHISITEHKTGKIRSVAINNSVRKTLDALRIESGGERKSRYLFPNGRKDQTPLSRSQAFRIIKEAALHAGLNEHISCHSLRKTFGYHAWKKGVPPALLMELYNHSSYRVTKQYLGIEQEEKDRVYLDVQI
ncbi:MAG: tyrosine-type recombinase/integrase [Bacteroidales bacterium]|nr:tyrosine-type recombinase/integrase [Bacteroidales bacterium]MCM1414886.1 tyrosine-type recombinase/integrase [bacterium]MCM1424063.1 tyrosine-type recombinase/integrase [bacterium]